VLKIDTTEFSKIIQERNGLGKTGESYLLGRTGDITRLRSDQLIRGGKTGEIIRDEYADQAFSGNPVRVIKSGKAGNLELSGYELLEIPGLEWVIVTSMSLEEVISPRIGNHDFFSVYARKYGYSDLMLIHPEGHIFYSVAKNPGLQKSDSDRRTKRWPSWSTHSSNR